MTKVAEMATACMNCAHHRNVHDGGHGGPHRSTWFYQICMAPEAKRPDEFDPVIGRHIEASRPHCREVNDGACPYYQEATG